MSSKTTKRLVHFFQTFFHTVVVRVNYNISEGKVGGHGIRELECIPILRISILILKLNTRDIRSPKRPFTKRCTFRSLLRPKTRIMLTRAIVRIDHGPSAGEARRMVLSNRQLGSGELGDPTELPDQ